ncbi:MAG TPA: hypothetical protein VFZ09_16035 [Archangium sp.]|uniref:hypothetical protein n=1 Tax=Archangium sp. TaxID=1872627 RepID=UPI002E34F0DC|nr:hypothetical protein [Archangium sp.]HEX5747758.1 hypothetical protein [Archangium sp.]
MFINQKNFQLAMFQASSNFSSSRGGSFASFSFSSAVFSSSSLGGLNGAYQKCPSNRPLNTLGNLFSSISMLQSFSTTFPQCGCPSRPPPCPSRPPPCPPEPQQHGKGKMWDVFFDTKSGTKTKQQSPIVLDLNGNGKADITGSNIKGNGKLEGNTVKGFDLNPSDRQWSTKSLNRRPGHGAPALGAGVTAKVFDKDGKLVKSLSAEQLKKLQGSKAWKKGGGDMGLGLGGGMRAEFRDGNGTLVSELKRDGTNKNKPLYFWGNQNQNEWTKPWDSKTGGDGMLVWDVDGDGKITSGKELFGHVDLNGKNTFKNGYEKLAHYFDKNGDGQVKGSELNGLKIWEDRNGDGITQKGELVDLEKHGIRKLNTQFNEADMSSSYSTRKPGHASAAQQTGQSPVHHEAMQQAWQIFQLVDVLRQMQAAGCGSY